jgi:hypothetical protein
MVCVCVCVCVCVWVCVCVCVCVCVWLSAEQNMLLQAQLKLGERIEKLVLSLKIIGNLHFEGESRCFWDWVGRYKVLIKYCFFFPRILESLSPLPRQDPAAIGCTNITSQ